MSPGFTARLARNRTAWCGFILLALITALALTAPLAFPVNPLDRVAAPMTWPFADPVVPLGTDRLGRDLAAGIAHGARVSLLIGLVAAAIAVAVGVAIGAAAGYLGGWSDEILMRVSDAVQTVPSFLLALAMVAVLGPSIPGIVLAVAIVSWPAVARVMRAEVMALKHREFVIACRALGMPRIAIVWRHILPNALPPVVVLATVIVAVAILIESALSFLGLGDPNSVTWGGMIGNGRAVLRTGWYVAAVPGAAIALTVFAVGLVGEGMNQALNPRGTR